MVVIPGLRRPTLVAALPLLALTTALAALGSCATRPREAEPLPEPERTTSAASAPVVPGTLLTWAEPVVVPARDALGLLDLATPGILATQFPLDNLEAKGYAEWRRLRRPTLGDASQVVITFAARRPDGSLESQSGSLFLPAPSPGTPRRLTWVVFGKGTELLKETTPSRGKGAELPFIKALASAGYAVFVPDYAGMGSATGIQDYCVPESLAASCLDGLAAARSWLARAMATGSGEYAESGRLVLMGYSEGGLAAMAALEALGSGRLAAPGLRLAAAYPLAAPLNLMVGVPYLGAGPALLGRPDYQVYLVLGWARAYPNLVKPEDILLAPVLAEMPPFLDGSRSAEEAWALMAKALGKRKSEIFDADLFRPEYLAALRTDPASLPYYRAQVGARLDRYLPPAGVRVRLAASPTDEVVRSSNSVDEVAYATAASPAADVAFLPLKAKDHMKGALEALLWALLDLDEAEALGGPPTP